MSTDEARELEAVASVVERLVALLAAGVSQRSVWMFLAEYDADDRGMNVFAAMQEPSFANDPVRAMVASMRSMYSGAHREAWAALAAVWRVASVTGAPLVSALRTLAVSLRECAATRRDIDIALAGPRATTRLVMSLPLVGIFFGVALGFDIIHTLFATIPGALSLVSAGLLCAVGSWWNGRLVRRATPRRAVPGCLVDVMAIALAGGVSIEHARAVVHEACVEAGMLVDESEWSVIDRVTAFARRAGAPVGELLAHDAARLRREARFEGHRSAMRLAVHVMIPLGLCVLPAFMLVSVVPLVVSVFSSTSWGSP